MPAASNRFPRYESKISRLPKRRHLTAADVLVGRFRLEAEGRLQIYYAPMEWVRPKARLIAVGITPGISTMIAAFEATRDGLVSGASRSRVLDEVKRMASFSNARWNLAGMLDDLGVNRWLGIDSSIDLWGSAAAPLFHPTSAIRYPVVKDGKNYSGHGPDPPRSPMLSRWLRDELAPELAMLPAALVVPLGIAVDASMALLIREGMLDEERCLVGFPHPSGANGRRVGQWEEQRRQLRRKAKGWFKSHP